MHYLGFFCLALMACSPGAAVSLDARHEVAHRAKYGMEGARPVSEDTSRKVKRSAVQKLKWRRLKYELKLKAKALMKPSRRRRRRDGYEWVELVDHEHVE